MKLTFNHTKIALKKNSPRGHKEIEVTLEHIASIKYQKQEVLVNLQQDNTWQSNVLNFLNERTNTDKLKGDFSPTQAKNFFGRYDLLKHCPNTSSGFSATLFYDTQAKDRDSKYILAIRGTEIALNDLSIDVTLAMGDIPMQCYELARFYEEQIKSHLDDKQKLIITGHSLGGLAKILLKNAR